MRSEIERRSLNDLETALRSVLERIASADKLTDSAVIPNGNICDAAESTQKALRQVRDAIEKEPKDGR